MTLSIALSSGLEKQVLRLSHHILYTQIIKSCYMDNQKCDCGTPMPAFAAYIHEYTCPKCGRRHLIGDMIQKADVYIDPKGLKK
jgi:hypothetical protein